MRFDSIKIKKKELILWGLIFVPYLLLIPAALWYFHKVNNIENSAFVIINKADMSLTLYNYKGELLQKSAVATGKNFGSKQSIGDLKTPEGIFTIASIEDASKWTHDFKDDSLGPIKDAYGPYFIRLNVPGQKGIGIHGTHDNNSIGSRASEGCIRMNNTDLSNLVNKLNVASVVVIVPGVDDIKKDFIDSTSKKELVQSKQTILKKELPSDANRKKVNIKSFADKNK